MQVLGMIRDGRKIPVDVKRRTLEIVRVLSRDSDVSALYSFGSMARGTLGPLSDLDFAVLLSGALDKKERFDKQLQLIGVFNDIFQTDEIDLVLLNDAPPGFCFNILKTGSLLYCRDKMEVVDFRERLVKLYLDFRYFRDSFDENFLTGIGYHG